MGNIFTSFFSRRQEMSPDQALEILYDTLIGQTPGPVGGDGICRNGSPVCQAGPAPLVMPGLTGHPSFAEWCHRLGLPRQKLDRYLRKELGCNGAEFVRTISAQRQRQ